MTFALSTNWNNRRLEDGEAIADEAIELGFDALELGYDTTPRQVPGLIRRLGQIRIGTVHAYAPVPPGAPTGHPELYQLADDSEDGRALAKVYLLKSLALASETGADTIVFHAGYVKMTPTVTTLFASEAARIRKHAPVLLDRFSRAFEALAPHFEKAGVTLALENLPRVNRFPNAEQAKILMERFKGAPLALWYDTGHARVCECRKWSDHTALESADRFMPFIRGMHLNDVESVRDDHFQPGGGKVDFAGLETLAQHVRHRVFEPGAHVPKKALGESLAYIRGLWSDHLSA